jgi:hypothetical protein
MTLKASIYAGFRGFSGTTTYMVFSKCNEPSSNGHKNELALGKRKASVVNAVSKGLF